jgi:hypothetical protein
MKLGGFKPTRLDPLCCAISTAIIARVPFFFIDYLYPCAKSVPPVIAGPPGTEITARQLCTLMYSADKEKLLPPIEFIVLQSDQPANVGELEIHPFRVPHQTEKISLGLRIHCQGKKILFSGDSLWSDIFIEQSQGVDLFRFIASSPVCMSITLECTPTAPLGCDNLVLTHHGDDTLQQRDSLIGIVADDGNGTGNFNGDSGCRQPAWRADGIGRINTR